MSFIRKVAALFMTFAILAFFQNCAGGTDLSQYSGQDSSAGSSTDPAPAPSTLPNPGPDSAPPVITDAPHDLTIPGGVGLDLMINATGTNLVYKWEKDGVVITGVTTNIYSIDPFTRANAGRYIITVSNSAGKVTAPFTITYSGP